MLREKLRDLWSNARLITSHMQIKDAPTIKRNDDKGVKYIDYLQVWLELLPRSLSN